MQFDEEEKLQMKESEESSRHLTADFKYNPEEEEYAFEEEEEEEDKVGCYGGPEGCDDDDDDDDKPWHHKKEKKTSEYRGDKGSRCPINKFKKALANINFDKVTPDEAKAMMEEKINRKMHKYGLIPYLIMMFFICIYAYLVKKA
jgi:hypothetical protein